MMYNPISTYRIQLNKDFTFEQLEALLPYLNELGISTIYASPITQAVPGSMHGYDVCSPVEINKEIGTLEQMAKLKIFLRQHGMGWLQDIVPNHMAYDINNPWLYDVLERGIHSDYYHFFDIGWDVPGHPSPVRIMVPFLEDDPATCIQNGKIKLGFDEKGFVLKYHDLIYPVSVSAYSWICDVLPDFLNPLLPWASKIEAFSLLPLPQWNYYKKKMIGEIKADSRLLLFIRQHMACINENGKLLEELIGYQHYVLTDWRRTREHINYRRFFTVNSLICLSMENEDVYNAYHRFILALLRDGLLQGLRIDHIDGLYDPAGYIEKLRESCGAECYIVAEKILRENEELPEHWPLQGTTGYDFLSSVNQLLTDGEGKQELISFYLANFAEALFSDIVFDKKYLYVTQKMGGELDNLVRLMVRLGCIDLTGDQLPKMKEALAVFLAAFPVYRIYPGDFPLAEESSKYIATAFSKAIQKGGAVSREIASLQTLFESDKAGTTDAARLLFLKRLMQFTVPLAAKGIEDTTFYVYNAFLAHNEVGDSPGHQPLTADMFHRQMAYKQSHIPFSMNATATHDTKRGEDSRIRLNILSMMPVEWMESVRIWRELNKNMISSDAGRLAPAPNDEYFIYQSLVGGFPADMHCSESFVKRFHDYITKALREADTETSWDEPDQEYKNNCHRFIDRILSRESPFLADFIEFEKKIVEKAAVFSLSQLLIKLTAPGVPDIYQGAELWDLNFVDPDNRRPVDYELRRKLLGQIADKEKEGPMATIDFLNQNKHTGIQKLFVIKKILAFRRLKPVLFSDGAYIPIQPASHLLAYMRVHADQKALVIAPLPAKDDSGGHYSFMASDGHLEGEWIDHFTGEQYSMSNNAKIENLFAKFPVAFLTN